MSRLRGRRKAYVAVAIIGLLPAVSVVLAGLIASANGCILHEGFANPCVVLGIDLGEILYSMGVMGWIAILTVPAALLAIAILVLDMIFEAIRKFLSR